MRVDTYECLMIMRVKEVTLSNVITVDEIDFKLTVSFASADFDSLSILIFFHSNLFISIAHYSDLAFKINSISLASSDC